MSKCITMNAYYTKLNNTFKIKKILIKVIFFSTMCVVSLYNNILRFIIKKIIIYKRHRQKDTNKKYIHLFRSYSVVSLSLSLYTIDPFQLIRGLLRFFGSEFVPLSFKCCVEIILFSRGYCIENDTAFSRFQSRLKSVCGV